MVDARDHARGQATEAGRRMAILLLAGTAFAGLCVFFLSRAILGPLERLTWAARRIEGGDLDLTVPVASRDELGQLAAAFNSMAGGLRDLRESDQARLLREHLREITANLHGLARLEGDFRQFHLESMAPADLIATAVARVKEGAEDEKVRLVIHVDPAEPRVLADPERVGLVLFNLLKNAVAHTPEGGSVTVSTEPEKGRTRFTVTDTGRGIPSVHLERIFEPLYQVPGTEDLGGAGIGLSLAKNIVQAHGGEIGCDSEEGRSTTFWFTLSVALD
jgi:signal transduction histidine kinase